MTGSHLGSTHFFPVLHLMTGPPGLARNGGIWKRVKSGLRELEPDPSFMVQALHFAQYNLSESSSEDWFGLDGSSTRLGSELEATFGPGRDVFVDSGGFQLLHSDKIDLSRWGLEVTARDIYRLQLRFRPTRIASLDSPLPPASSWWTTRKLMQISTRNAVELCSLTSDKESDPFVYLVAHGRTPREVRRHLEMLRSELPSEVLSRRRIAFALGSQVPLSGNPERIVENVAELNTWMDSTLANPSPLHVFGIGDAVAGELQRRIHPERLLSYDNSTYVQSAFRLKTYDPATHRYREYHPLLRLRCDCVGCGTLQELGREFVADLMSRPPYQPSYVGEKRVNRSDILANVALHNLSWWKDRVSLSPHRSATPRAKPTSTPRREAYRFPLAEFKPIGKSLLLLPCSKTRPYAKSTSHQRITKALTEAGLEVGTDYDRVTLSGFFGPVHWDHEDHPAVQSYDFRLDSSTHKSHHTFLRFRAATVLSVIAGRYTSIAAFLRNRAYRETYEPVIERFDGKVATETSELVKVLRTGRPRT